MKGIFFSGDVGKVKSLLKAKQKKEREGLGSGKKRCRGHGWFW